MERELKEQSVIISDYKDQVQLKTALVKAYKENKKLYGIAAAEAGIIIGMIIGMIF